MAKSKKGTTGQSGNKEKTIKTSEHRKPGEAAGLAALDELRKAFKENLKKEQNIN